LAALVGFGAGLVLASVFGAVAASASGYTGAPGQALPVSVTAADVAGLWIGLVASAVWASRTRGTGSLATDYGLRVGTWRDLVGGTAAGLGAQFILIPLLYLPFTANDPSLARRLGQPAQRDVVGAHGALSAIALLVLLAVGAPVVEELFFRGLLMRSLLAHTPVPVAIVLSALLFALAHFESLQFFGLATFGVVLGALAWRTGRLAPGIAAHAAFNAAAVISLIIR